MGDAYSIIMVMAQSSFEAGSGSIDKAPSIIYTECYTELQVAKHIFSLDFCIVIPLSPSEGCV